MLTLGLVLAAMWRCTGRLRPGTSELASTTSAVYLQTVCSRSGMYEKQFTDPLNVLPPEFVEYIFHLWLFDAGIYLPTRPWKWQLPALLCLVSRSWRDFVYASPRLWAHVTFNTSKGAVPTLHALQKRLVRSQSVPLTLNIMIEERPDRDALRVLFAESSRFHYLTLSVRDLSWCNDIPMQALTQLSELTIHTRYQSPMMDTLSAIFSSAPHLRRANWHCISDPGPIGVNGHQLHSLYLTGACLPGTRVLEVLAACPNLRNASFSLAGQREDVTMTERMLLPDLPFLSFGGNTELKCPLGSIQAPLLSHLDMTRWCFNLNNRESDFEVLESFLAFSPILEEIALGGFLDKENQLISIITNNENLARLTVSRHWSWRQTSFITHRTFQLLTRQEHGIYVLPRLEKLHFEGRLDVTDEVVLRMIESRMSPPDDIESSSHSRRVCTLKSIYLDLWKPMEKESISRLQTICRESGLKAEGSFLDPRPKQVRSTHFLLSLFSSLAQCVVGGCLCIVDTVDECQAKVC
ncbi:hypothetical protein PAXINDRAFT_100404 [Paxillus involutus ATCC 200175]|uniref:F-box domain-containing protein n=1 Tax=Paxillus involutus ATCC 200175 TaxID=664439 RepID=A0A0C9U2S4_PAXIN|nr:hypothetical protein PAXINDRAFT_100404 [Paxillus involutus ATCC 200175]